jgi:hypothetical protein
LPGEHKGEEEMLGCFLFLVAKRASSSVRQAPLGEAISGPNALLDG